MILLYRLGHKGTWSRVEQFFNVDRTKLNKTYSFVRRYVWRRFGSLLKLETLLPLVRTAAVRSEIGHDGRRRTRAAMHRSLLVRRCTMRRQRAKYKYKYKIYL